MDGQCHADLTDIGDYIAKESVRYAELTVSQLFSAPDTLEKHPRRGHIVPEFMDESLRQLMVGNYRIVYQLTDDRVNILTVHHGKRLISNTRHFKRKK